MLSLTQSSHQYNGEATISYSSTTVSALDVLQALHDPQFLIYLNPEVESAVVDEKDNTTWHITYKLSFLGFIPMSTTGTARFLPVVDGMDIEAFAAAGTCTKSQWRLHQPDANGSVRVTEECTVKTFFALGPYVWKTYRAVHDGIMSTLSDKIQNRQS